MARKKKSKRQAQKKQQTVYIPLLRCRLVQIVSIQDALFGLDDQGRVFAFVETDDRAGWFQIEGDDQHFLLKQKLDNRQVGPTGNGSNVARLAGDTLTADPSVGIRGS